VQTTPTKEVLLFQMIPKEKGRGIKGNTFSKGRILVGRTESCEFIISSGAISAVHAVLEVTPKGAKLFDMNSKNGTYVNGEKVVASQLNIGDTVSFGNVSFTFQSYIKESELPPILDTLEPKTGAASIITTNLPTVPIETKEEAKLPQAPVESEEVPYIVYPLATDPKADYSEYIFEDAEELYPVFQYDHGQQAIEIIILFRDKVYSVDYLTNVNGLYSIVGKNAKKNELEFAYLGKDEKVPFVEISSGNCIVHKLHNYSTQHLSNEEISEVADGRVNLQGEDIVRLENGELEIYVRKVSAPPKVKSPPFFRRDKELKKYILIGLFFFLTPFIALKFVDVDKEMDKEKDPERIATILYKQPLKISKSRAVTKTKKTPPKKQKAPKKIIKKKPSVAKVKTAPKKVKTKKKVVKAPGVKTAAKKQQVKKVKRPAPKTAKAVAKKRAGGIKSTSVNKRTARKSPVRSKRQGTVDVYKSFDFKSTVSSLVAKGGSLKGAKTHKSSSSQSIGGANIGGGVATNLRKADSGTQVGSLTGSTVGKLAQSKGSEGLSSKTGIFTAGIPSETVVLGSMDPDVIRRILREHIPQFRYCYQKELDRNASKRVTGTISLLFTIGASGHVSRAGVAGRTKLPTHVKRCVVGVLNGIQFPRPLGGGTVDVKQPFNFYPKDI